MEGTIEPPYSAKDISLSLDIGDSTLRKWCLALEEHGYEFYRTDQNKRLFTEKDIIVLKHFGLLVKEKNMSMTNAALIVTARFKKEVFSNETDVEQLEEEMNSVPAIRSQEDLIQTLVTKVTTLEEQQEHFLEMQKNFIKSLMEEQKNEFIAVNRTLVERLEEQQKYIEERLNKRDEMLVQSLRETLETKKMLLAAKEEDEKQKEFTVAKEKERDELLKKSLEESLETKKMIASAIEEERQKEQQKKPRRGFIARLLGKD